VGGLTWSPTQWAAGGTELLHRAGRWWLRELLALFPIGIAEWLTDHGSKALLLSGNDDTIVLQVLNERRRVLATERIARVDYTPDVIDVFLRAQGLGRAGVSIGLQLPKERVFARSLLLPIETARTIASVLVQDLLAKTPFRLADIYQDHAARRTGDRLHVRQWVVRRSFVADATKELGLAPGGVAFVEMEGEGEDLRPCIRLQPGRSHRTSPVRWAFASLIASACALAVLACGLKYHRQQQALDALAVELNTARAKARRVRAAMEKLEAEGAALLRLRGRKQAPGLLDTWEEITRILPAHSWLTELRLSDLPGSDGQQLVISGFSPAAASLVGLIDRSALFRDAALTAPVTIDTSEGKERFAIQAKLRAVDPLRTAAR
jgi:general secretion pathway protein L